MESSLDQAPAYYWASGGDGLLLEINQTLLHDLGYTKGELTGKPIEFLFTLATRIFYQTHLHPLLQLKSDAEEIFISLTGSDKRTLSVLCNIKKTIRNGNTVIVYAGIAVENRKKFEHELIEAKKTAEAALRENTALIQAKKELEQAITQSALNLDLIRLQNDELRQFNHVVTHVLQEPIRKIALFSGMLADAEGNGSEETKKTREKLVRAAAQIGLVVSGLQQYARLTDSSNPFVETDITAKLQLVKRKLENEHPDIGLSMLIKPVKSVTADPDQIELLLYHILSNALTFRKPGQQAVVHIDSMVIQQNQLSQLPGKYKYSDYLKIEFRDEGLGFDPAYKGPIFEIFRKLQSSSGTGIGLALCKKIVDNHHGKIMADAVPGKGAVITVLLPVKNTQ